MRRFVITAAVVAAAALTVEAAASLNVEAAASLNVEAAASLEDAAQTRATKPPAKPASRTSTAFACAAELGSGVASRRRFCEVTVATIPAGSVSVTIPPHTGPATLMFDLHNRFTVPATPLDPGQAFVRQVAVAAVIKQTGDVIERAAVERDYRTPTDLFDRIGGAARGAAPKAVAPGQPMPFRITIPAGVGIVGIVGARLEEWRPSGRAAFDSPGRPIAIVSNVRVDYTPR